MQRITAIIAVAVALVVPTAASAHPYHRADAAVRVVPAKSCSGGYVKGTIGGAVKCLRAGEYCSIAYKKQYVKYGFTCSGHPARLHRR